MKQATLHLAKGLGIATLVMASSAAFAAETVTVPVSVSVNNAIDFTFTGTLDFGTVRATASSVALDCRILNLPANPASPIAAQGSYPKTGDFNGVCTNVAPTAALTAVGGTPARPVFTVQGLAPFTALTLTLPTAVVDLSAVLPGDYASFQVGDFTAYKTSAPVGNVPTTAGGLVADATGLATFTVGASLATDATVFTGSNYQDGVPYSGTFDVTVAY